MAIKAPKFLTKSKPPTRYGHRLSIDPRSKDFDRVQRRILLCMPSDSQELQHRFYNETIDAAGLAGVTGVILQVGSGVNGIAGFPEFGFNPEDINAYERGIASLNAAWSPGPFEGLFYDHEPSYTDENGRSHWWSGRTRYTEPDVQFMHYALEELARHGLPMSQYGIPRVPKTSRMDFFQLRDLATSRPMLDGCSWVQLNYYPQTSWASGDTISPDIEAGIRESIQSSVRAYRILFPDKQIVPFLFARYGNVANRHYFSILLDEFGKFDFIKSIGYWTNPHLNTNGVGSAMTDHYIGKFHEVKDSLIEWVKGG